MKESELQTSICEYVKLQYPSVIFNSDLSGIRTSIGLALKIKKLRSSNSIPDMYLDEPRGGYFGLKIELKIKNIYKKNGDLFKSDHLENQKKMLDRLNEKGYLALFSIGFDATKKIIDDYMSLDVTFFEKQLK